ELPSWLEVTSVSDGGTTTVEGEIPTVTFDIASLPVGSSFRRFIKAKVADGAVAGSVLNPVARLSYEDAVVDNVAKFPISVAAKASPLQLKVEAVADPVVPGGDGLYL